MMRNDVGATTNAGSKGRGKSEATTVSLNMICKYCDFVRKFINKMDVINECPKRKSIMCGGIEGRSGECMYYDAMGKNDVNIEYEAS